MAAAANNSSSQFRGALNATYASAFPASQAITYNADGSVATVTDNRITTTYTYNSDGTVATDSRAVGGVTTTRTYTYTNGNLTGIEAA
jgi:YD repeat-containing protein